MKKIILAVVAFIFSLSFAVSSFATWTIGTATIDVESQGVWMQGMKSIRVKIVCTSDGAAAAEFNLSDQMAGNDFMKIRGMMWSIIDIVPGAGGVAPNAAFTISFDNDLGSSVLDIAAASHTANTIEDGGFLPMWDIQVTIGDIGDAGDQITLYFTFEGVAQ